MSNGNGTEHTEEQEHGAKFYRVQIDKQIFEISDRTPSARELLVLSGKNPPEQYALYLKRKGGQPERLTLDQRTDLAEPGVERFVTLPLDQTEGLGGRRDFDLPSEDQDWLEGVSLQYELVRDDAVLRVVIYDWPLPPGYNLSTAAVNVRIEPGYPDAQIDMAYFHPPLAREDGRPIGALADDHFDGKTWQRWSRHRTPANPWRPGIDNLATHFGLVVDWLHRELAKE